MARFERIIIFVSHALKWIACGLVAAMMFLTCADVFGRYLGYPVRGTYDITEILAVMIVSFSIAYTQIIRGHISVDFLVLKLPQRLRAVIGVFTNLLSLGFFMLLVWQSYEFGGFYLSAGKLSMTEHIPLFPVVYAMAFGCILVCLVLFLDFVKSLAQVVGK